MSQGTLYVNGLARGILPQSLIETWKLDIKVEQTDCEVFAKEFPMAKIPAFIGPNGFHLTEVMAVLYYRMLKFCC